MFNKYLLTPLFTNEAMRSRPPRSMILPRMVVTGPGVLEQIPAIIAELDIKEDLWFFECHFEGDPVMPGCLGLDAMWQLLGFFLLWSGLHGSGRALGADEIKFFGQVLPHAKKVAYKIDIRRIISRGAIVGVADGEMFVDGKKIYSANRAKT